MQNRSPIKFKATEKTFFYYHGTNILLSIILCVYSSEFFTKPFVILMHYTHVSIIHDSHYCLITYLIPSISSVLADVDSSLWNHSTFLKGSTSHVILAASCRNVAENS